MGRLWRSIWEEGNAKVALAALFFLNLLLRLPTLTVKLLNIDEAQWGAMANRIVAGDAPYVTVIGEKPPLLYLFYAAVFRLCGPDNYVAVRAVGLLWVFVTALALWILLEKTHGRREGILAAGLFIVYSTTLLGKTTCTSGEALMNLPLSLSSLLLVVAGGGRGVRRKSLCLVLAGVAAGLGGLFRWQAGIQLAVAGSWLVFFLPLLAAPGRERRQVFFRGLYGTVLFTLAFCAVWAAAFVALWAAGSWEAFYKWAVEFSLGYVRSGGETISPWRKGFERTAVMVSFGLVWWAFAMLALARTLRGIKANIGRGLAACRTHGAELLYALWFLWGFLALSTGGRFYYHYYLQVFPPLSCLAAIGLTKFIEGGAKKRSLALVALLVALPAAVFLGVRFNMERINLRFHELDLAPVNEEVGLYIKERTRPSDRIYIWGWGNAIHVHARRDLATRFFAADFLTGRVPGSPTVYEEGYDSSAYAVPGAWDALFADLRAHPPVYVVDTSPIDMHDYGKYPLEKFPRLKSWIDANYSRETEIGGIVLYRKYR